MESKVFMSVGGASTKQQENFIVTIEEYLRGQGLVPQTLGRTAWSSEQPLKAVKKLMHECAGTIILAYERTHVVEAMDRRGSPRQVALNNYNLPTVWNQIEAVMAYMLDHPLLVIVEHGLKNEGLLEEGYDWFVLDVDMDLKALEEPKFKGVISDWKERVEEYQRRMIIAADEGPDAADASKTENTAEFGSREHLIKLRQLLDERFSDSQLRLFCFDLDIDYQNLPGESHAVKAMELVAEMKRQGRLTELVESGNKKYPQLDWEP